jgi:TetR/AcrR family transcriptional repressor of nem operon
MRYAAEGNIDLMPAGHTHAGQYFPGPALHASCILYSGCNTVWVQRPEPEATSGAHDRSESQARPDVAAAPPRLVKIRAKKEVDILERLVYFILMKRIHNKEDIVQIGLDIILSNGFNATGVEAILKQAKVPKGSFYNFFSSKEEFGLAIIDKFVAERGEVFYPIFSDESLPPLERVKKSFETLIARFEGDNCTMGCLIGNLGQEMSDHFENVRQRLEESLQMWIRWLTTLLLQAQQENTIPADMDAEMLAENVISSFQGALLRSKVKKSPEPLRNFIHLYFDIFLAQGEGD